MFQTTFPIRPLVLLFALTLLADKYALANEPLSSEQRTQCEQLLLDSLNEQGEWSSVHAAEYLIRLDKRRPVLAAFQPQTENASAPFRIGVWRVLAQAEATLDKQREAIEKIRHVLLDKHATDRLHALESLAKLNEPINSPAELQVVQQMSAANDPGCSFALWRMFQQRPSAQLLQKLTQQLHSPDAVARLRAGFVLSQLDELPAKFHLLAQQTLAKEPIDSAAYPYIASACGNATLKKLLASQDPNHQALAIRELARRSQSIDLDLTQALSAENPLALRQAAAFALLARDTNTSNMQP